MLTVNAVYRLIVLSKKHGKGKLSNGEVLTKLVGTLMDNEGSDKMIQYSLVFDADDPIKLNRYSDKFMQNRIHYPFYGASLGMSMERFQVLVQSDSPDFKAYLYYLKRMSVFCYDVLDPIKIPALVFTLLTMMQTDDSLQAVFYNCRMILKDDFIGSTVRPKHICVEALLLGLWYHVHLKKNLGNAKELTLLGPPVNPLFSAFMISDKITDLTKQSKGYLEQLLQLDQAVTLTEQLRELKPEIKQSEALYPLEICYQGQVYPAEQILSLTQDPLFLQADGAMGKTTLLRSRMGFYLPLGTYKKRNPGASAPAGIKLDFMYTSAEISLSERLFHDG